MSQAAYLTSVPQDLATITPLDDVLAEIVERRGEFRAQGYVSQDVIDSLKQAGIYRASTPLRFGGDALPPADFLA